MLQDSRQELLSLFSEREKAVIEELRNATAAYRGHPLTGLVLHEGDGFESQHLANVLRCLERINKYNPDWFKSSKIRRRLLSPLISTSSGVLGELKAYGYLLTAFPATTPIPEKKNSTPDFLVPHYLGEPADPVYVEVHSMAWSGEMDIEFQKFSDDFNDGNIGHESGGVRIAELPLQPFSGKKRDSLTEDAVSKIAGIGHKAAQIPDGAIGVVWLNFEQADWELCISTDDSFPMYSMSTGGARSGLIWNALYGINGMPLYEDWPDRKSMVLQHPGMFANTDISAVIVNLSRSVVLFENPAARVPLPDWFRSQCFNLPWFRLQFSRVVVDAQNFASSIERERELCRAIQNIQVMANW